MQGNVRALKNALNHELIYRDSAAKLDKVQKPVEPYRKVKTLKCLQSLQLELEECN